MLCQIGTTSYRLRAFDPPQTSVLDWGQGKLQFDGSTTAPPFRIPVPQKHWVPYSIPAKVKPWASQADWHASTVPPDTVKEVLSVRASVLSE